MLDLSTAVPKAPQLFDRSVALERTLEFVPALRRRFGITRIADCTLLDRARVPVFSAIVPDSRDPLGIYNGKGRSREHALVGAVMEAVERQAAAEAALPIHHLDESAWADGIDPRALLLDVSERQRSLPFVAGYDVVREADTFVPLGAVEWPGTSAAGFSDTTTNGLASGNTLLEAAYHAILELIERHIWSLAHAVAHVRPLRVLRDVLGATRNHGRTLVDDPIGACIEQPTGNAELDALLARILDANLEIRMLAVDPGPLPLTVFASVWQPDAPTPTAHLGIGTSWSPAAAALRAVSEAMQSRVADFQAAREDIVRAGTARGRLGTHARRLARMPAGRWYYDAPAARRTELAALADRSSNCLRNDFARIVTALRACGVSRCAIVDLTPSDTPVFVVRAVAPDLESAAVDGRIGRTIARILDTSLAVPQPPALQ